MVCRRESSYDACGKLPPPVKHEVGSSTPELRRMELEEDDFRDFAEVARSRDRSLTLMETEEACTAWKCGESISESAMDFPSPNVFESLAVLSVPASLQGLPAGTEGASGHPSMVRCMEEMEDMFCTIRLKSTYSPAVEYACSICWRALEGGIQLPCMGSGVQLVAFCCVVLAMKYCHGGSFTISSMQSRLRRAGCILLVTRRDAAFMETSILQSLGWRMQFCTLSGIINAGAIWPLLSQEESARVHRAILSCYREAVVVVPDGSTRSVVRGFLRCTTNTRILALACIQAGLQHCPGEMDLTYLERKLESAAFSLGLCSLEDAAQCLQTLREDQAYLACVRHCSAEFSSL